jgi:hypothetical protein
MKQLLATLWIVAGAAAAIVGVALTPLFKGYLPAALFSIGDEQAGHPYFIVTQSGPQGPDYLPYVLVLLGAIMLVVGVAYRRRLRAIA